MLLILFGAFVAAIFIGMTLQILYYCCCYDLDDESNVKRY